MIQVHNGAEFPHIITGTGDLPTWLKANKAVVDEALAVAGTVLFRGFHITTPEDVDATVEAYGEAGFTYGDSLSNAVRVNLTPRIFTANEAPPDVSIFLHHEMAQTPLFPSKLFFSCMIAPETGGSTPICRSDIVFDRLQIETPELVAALSAHGVRYSNTMPGQDDPNSGQGRSWRSTLSCETRAEAETRLSNLGYTYIWNEDDTLRVTSPALPAIKTLPDGSESFFNQLIAAFRGWKDARNDPSKSVTLGNGEPLDADALGTAIQIADELSFDLNWQVGDVALLDNFRVMHGRRPYTGKRRVVAALIA
jgi:alpha-ketoglutarate-dependent taurine dioxygenase